MIDLAAITALVEPEANALGFDLVRVRWFGGDDPTLQIMAERPATGQLTIDDCARLSRRISERFDAVDPIEEAYRLEVSSPGIDRPLTRLKDFAAWIGFDARVTLSAGVQAANDPVDGPERKNLTGVIDGVEDDLITLIDRKAGEISFPFALVAEAKLILNDALLAAAQPLSTAGADEFDEDAFSDDPEANASED